MEKRLDLAVAEKENISRAKAQHLIASGKVMVDNRVAEKSSTIVSEKNSIEILSSEEYVSRGAYKLLKAADFFKIDFQNKVVLDIGASTGGFSEVALQKGAKKVYAVDVGEGQLDESLVKTIKL